MSRIIIEATHIDPNVCFECGAPATERHHVVPASLGGTKTIPLCGECHAKVHDISNGERRNQLRELTKNSLTKRKELIMSQGGFYSKSGRWVTKIGRDKGVDLTKASRASSLSKKREALKWFQESPAVKFAHEQIAQGATRKQVLEKLSELYDIDPKMWGTHKGARVSPGILSRWLSDKNPKEIQEVDFDTMESEETEAIEPKVNKKAPVKKRSNVSKRSRLSAEEEKRSKQEWLQNSEACNYVRSLFGSYKTRYLLAGEKIKLFNQRHELRSGNKITSPAQWSVLAKDLGFSGIPTGAYKKTEFLYEWALKSSKDLVEARIVERKRYNEVEGYAIYPTRVQIDLLELHTWWSFLDGLTLDGIIAKSSNDGELPTYRFISREVVDKILRDMAE